MAPTVNPEVTVTGSVALPEEQVVLALTETLPDTAVELHVVVILFDPVPDVIETPVGTVQE